MELTIFARDVISIAIWNAWRNATTENHAFSEIFLAISGAIFSQFFVAKTKILKYSLIVRLMQPILICDTFKYRFYVGIFFQVGKFRLMLESLKFNNRIF